MLDADRMTTATPEDFFEGSDRGLVLYRAVVQAMQSFDADVDLRVSRSQIAFRRRRGFAYVWVLGGAGPLCEKRCPACSQHRRRPAAELGAIQGSRAPFPDGMDASSRAA